MVVHVDRPDHAGVVLAGVHEVPDQLVRLVLVDSHRPGAWAGPVLVHPVQDAFPEFLFRSVDFGVRHSVVGMPGHDGGHGAPAGAGVWRRLVHNESRGFGGAEPFSGDGLFSRHLLLRSVFLLSHAGLSGEMPRRFREGGGCRFPWFWGGFRCSDGLFSGSAGGPGFPRRRGVFTHAAPGPRGIPPGPAFRAAPTGAFLPFLPGVFRSVGERRRPRARRKITGPQKTGLCKKNARGSPATGCRVCTLGSVQ